MDRAAREHDGLAVEIAQRADAAAAADQELGAGDEHGRREGDGLAPLGGVRRRAAFEIDRTRGHELEAVLGRHGPVFDGEILADFAGNLVDDDFAEVERISDRLPFRVEERERRRVLAVAQANDTRLVDPLERAGGIGDDRRAGSLRDRRGCRQKRANRRDDGRPPCGADERVMPCIVSTLVAIRRSPNLPRRYVMELLPLDIDRRRHAVRHREARCGYRLRSACRRTLPHVGRWMLANCHQFCRLRAVGASPPSAVRSWQRDRPVGVVSSRW